MKKVLVTKENPLVILPSLAMKIGLREAIILQQINYWLTKKGAHVIEGRKWIYNTYQEWQKQFPFWSETTIKRSFLKLEKQGLLISGNWNALKMDKTKWYTINYEKLDLLELSLFDPSKVSPEQSLSGTNTETVHSSSNTMSSTGLDEPSNVTESIVEGTVLTQAIPEITTENTSKKEIPIVEILDYLNHKTHSNYKPTTKKTKTVIKARMNEGYTLVDFKKVIDLKTAEWLDDPHWNKFLRPETLFGTKFESYLNQKGFKKKKITEEDLNLDD
ncbi:MAG: conserved phage C-terminal domain-containing protein [Bacillota bacterium]|nr:conserved phage C-terminal domain-containing protein [Bacillota bacterium]